MTVASTDCVPVTVSPSSVRYSLSMDNFGNVRRGFLSLQRAEKRDDGTWMDDPQQGSRTRVSFPPDADTAEAWSGIENLLPSILQKVNGPLAYSGYRIQLLGSLDSNGILDIVVQMQLLTTTGWQCVCVPSLNAFLAENADFASSILLAWASQDPWTRSV